MSETVGLDAAKAQTRHQTPRLGFVGVGGIGRLRMESVAQYGAGEVVGIADISREACELAVKAAPKAVVAESFEQLLEMDLDGVVIATPNALHPEQCIAAFEKGVAVFCQKPLARTAEETQAIVDAARRADRLLGIDLSYRHLDGVRKMRHLVSSKALGEVYAADLVFHNAYGPATAWFYDTRLAGGGCVLDLGIHLVDLGMWMFDFPGVESVTSRLYSAGEAFVGRARSEDYAEARIDLSNGTTLRLTCSWRLHAGRDAVIEALFYGTKGAVALRNVDGSFVDFSAEHFVGRERTLLSQPPDDWGGRAAVGWARQLAEGGGFDPEVEHIVRVAQALDSIYAE